jgi:transketolase
LGERGKEANSGFIGMSGFGASAPASTLFEHYGITPKQIIELAKSKL